MDLQLFNGRISFLWYQMEDQINRNGSKEFKTRDEIREYIKDIHECRVIGHISEETAKKWKDGEHGKLWVVSLHSDNYVFCLSCGIIVV